MKVSKEVLRDYLIKADFVLWEDCLWAPPGAVVDWASDYDKEVSELVRLVVQTCITLSDPHTRTKIIEHFGVTR